MSEGFQNLVEFLTMPAPMWSIFVLYLIIWAAISTHEDGKYHRKERR